jgi:hypothetical protein
MSDISALDPGDVLLLQQPSLGGGPPGPSTPASAAQLMPSVSAPCVSATTHHWVD